MTSEILMIRPAKFAFNAETAVNNSFQHEETDGSVSEKALKEFDDFTSLLISNGVEVTIIQDSPEPFTPDSIFPNNWISFHEPNTICLYPMFAENRRQERKPFVLETLKEKFDCSNTVDFSENEKNFCFLEGTGSIVLDRANKIAYACRSPRTDEGLFKTWSEHFNYTPILFDALDENGKPIYHTNVMMCIGDSFVVVCLDCVQDNDGEKQVLIDAFIRTNKKIVEISYEQVNQFAGNMLQIKNNKGELLLVMSTCAFNSLSQIQLAVLENHSYLVHSPLDTIEKNGGGSARCMMAEIYVHKKSQAN